MLRNSKLGLALAAIAAFSMWFYVQRVLIPYQEADAAVHGQPRGILSDLYPRWVGARELLLHGTNPYGEEVTRQIQQGYYGRVLDPRRADDPKDEQRFAYPVYVVFLLAPTITLPFGVVRSGFTVLLVLLTAASVLMWIRALRWQPSVRVLSICVLLSLGSFPVAQGIKLQQLSLLVSGLLSAAAAAVSCGFLISGGILLALATIKPQLVWLPLAGMMLWTVRDWRNRQRLAWSFGLALMLLLLGSYLVLPTWTTDFLEAIRAYHQYTRNVSVLGLLFTPVLGNVMAVLLVLTTLWIVWPLLRQPADHRNFGLAVTTLVALGVLVAPMFAPYNQVLLVPAVMLLASQAEALRRRNRLTRLLSTLAALALLWPWIAAAVLSVALLFAPRASVQKAWSLPLYTTFMIPVMVFALTALWAAKREIGRVSN
jgi:hypothetical protein